MSCWGRLTRSATLQGLSLPAASPSCAYRVGALPVSSKSEREALNTECDSWDQPSDHPLLFLFYWGEIQCWWWVAGLKALLIHFSSWIGSCFSWVCVGVLSTATKCSLLWVYSGSCEYLPPCCWFSVFPTVLLPMLFWAFLELPWGAWFPAGKGRGWGSWAVYPLLCCPLLVIDGLHCARFQFWPHQPLKYVTFGPLTPLPMEKNLYASGHNCALWLVQSVASPVCSRHLHAT